MSNENSHSPKDDVAARLALLQAANEGRLDGLPCPRCRTASVSVWFTRRSANDYWTWFLCADCRFEMRAQGARPAYYSCQRERLTPVAAEPPSEVNASGT
jgi:hypothetical protein